MDSFCPNYSQIILSSPTPTGKRLLSRLRCKSWSCEYCGDIQAKMWRAHIIDSINRLADNMRVWSLVTFTARGEDRSPAKTLAQVQNVWREVTQVWRQTHRAWGLRPPEYVRTYEGHADGAIHLHAIVAHEANIDNYKAGRPYARPASLYPLRGDRYPEGNKIRLKDLSVAFGGGHQADCKRFESPNAGLVSAYVTKYITKEIQSSLQVPDRFRRIQCSEGFGGFGDMGQSELTWEAMDYIRSFTYAHIRADGHAVYDLQAKRDVTPEDFHNLSEAYPTD